MKLSRFIPFVVFALLVAFLFAGLRLDNRTIKSPLLGQPMPAVVLPMLADETALFDSAQLRGQPWLLNVWASWCAPCRVENPFLLRLKGEGAVIVGLSYKDAPADALAWLNEWGNPFAQTLVDDGVLSVDWGVYGVPETFVIDGAGVLRYKHIGPITEYDLRETVRPLLVSLRAEARL